MPSWSPPAPRRSGGTLASQRTCERAARAVRTSKGCWPRCATKRNNWHAVGDTLMQEENTQDSSNTRILRAAECLGFKVAVPDERRSLVGRSERVFIAALTLRGLYAPPGYSAVPPDRE